MFQIGEFSKLARVSKRLLHHYEDIGLFKPAHVDQFSGYRYYSANQIPLLNKILALRDLGFTLEQIADMLQNNIPEQEIRGMLRMKQAETEKTIQQEQLRLKGIEARLQMLDMTDADLDVVIKEIPETHFLSTRQSIEKPEDVINLVQVILQQTPNHISGNQLGRFMAVIHTEEFRHENNDVDLGFITKKLITKPLELSSCTLNPKTLPKVTSMATAVQVGGAELVFMALGKIAAWIEQNGYMIAGPYRELVLEAGTLSEMNNSLIEIQMPVKPKD